MTSMEHHVSPVIVEGTAEKAYKFIKPVLKIE
jgi:hypothetical protein